MLRHLRSGEGDRHRTATACRIGPPHHTGPRDQAKWIKHSYISPLSHPSSSRLLCILLVALWVIQGAYGVDLSSVTAVTSECKAQEQNDGSFLVSAEYPSIKIDTSGYARLTVVQDVLAIISQDVDKQTDVCVNVYTLFRNYPIGIYNLKITLCNGSDCQESMVKVIYNPIERVECTGYNQLKNTCSFQLTTPTNSLSGTLFYLIGDNNLSWTCKLNENTIDCNQCNGATELRVEYSAQVALPIAIQDFQIPRVTILHNESRGPLKLSIDSDLKLPQITLYENEEIEEDKGFVCRRLGTAYSCGEIRGVAFGIKTFYYKYGIFINKAEKEREEDVLACISGVAPGQFNLNNKTFNTKNIGPKYASFTVRTNYNVFPIRDKVNIRLYNGGIYFKDDSNDELTFANSMDYRNNKVTLELKTISTGDNVDKIGYKFAGACQEDFEIFDVNAEVAMPKRVASDSSTINSESVYKIENGNIYFLSDYSFLYSFDHQTYKTVSSSGYNKYTIPVNFSSGTDSINTEHILSLKDSSQKDFYFIYDPQIKVSYYYSRIYHDKSQSELTFESDGSLGDLEPLFDLDPLLSQGPYHTIKKRSSGFGDITPSSATLDGMTTHITRASITEFENIGKITNYTRPECKKGTVMMTYSLHDTDTPYIQFDDDTPTKGTTSNNLLSFGNVEIPIDWKGEISVKNRKTTIIFNVNKNAFLTTLGMEEETIYINAESNLQLTVIKGNSGTNEYCVPSRLRLKVERYCDYDSVKQECKLILDAENVDYSKVHSENIVLQYPANETFIFNRLDELTDIFKYTPDNTFFMVSIISDAHNPGRKTNMIYSNKLPECKGESECILIAESITDVLCHDGLLNNEEGFVTITNIDYPYELIGRITLSSQSQSSIKEVIIDMPMDGQSLLISSGGSAIFKHPNSNNGGYWSLIIPVNYSGSNIMETFTAVIYTKSRLQSKDIKRTVIINPKPRVEIVPVLIEQRKYHADDSNAEMDGYQVKFKVNVDQSNAPLPEKKVRKIQINTMVLDEDEVLDPEGLTKFVNEYPFKCVQHAGEDKTCVHVWIEYLGFVGRHEEYIPISAPYSNNNEIVPSIENDIGTVNFSMVNGNSGSASIQLATDVSAVACDCKNRTTIKCSGLNYPKDWNGEFFLTVGETVLHGTFTPDQTVDVLPPIKTIRFDEYLADSGASGVENNCDLYYYKPYVNISFELNRKQETYPNALKYIVAKERVPNASTDLFQTIYITCKDSMCQATKSKDNSDTNDLSLGNIIPDFIKYEKSKYNFKFYNVFSGGAANNKEVFEFSLNITGEAPVCTDDASPCIILTNNEYNANGYSSTVFNQLLTEYNNKSQVLTTSTINLYVPYFKYEQRMIDNIRVKLDYSEDPSENIEKVIYNWKDSKDTCNIRELTFWKTQISLKNPKKGEMWEVQVIVTGKNKKEEIFSLPIMYGPDVTLSHYITKKEYGCQSKPCQHISTIRGNAVFDEKDMYEKYKIELVKFVPFGTEGNEFTDNFANIEDYEANRQGDQIVYKFKDLIGDVIGDSTCKTTVRGVVLSEVDGKLHVELDGESNKVNVSLGGEPSSACTRNETDTLTFVCDNLVASSRFVADPTINVVNYDNLLTTNFVQTSENFKDLFANITKVTVSITRETGSNSSTSQSDANSNNIITITNYDQIKINIILDQLHYQFFNDIQAYVCASIEGQDQCEETYIGLTREGASAYAILSSIDVLRPRGQSGKMTGLTMMIHDPKNPSTGFNFDFTINNEGPNCTATNCLQFRIEEEKYGHVFNTFPVAELGPFENFENIKNVQWTLAKGETKVTTNELPASIVSRTVVANLSQLFNGETFGVVYKLTCRVTNTNNISKDYSSTFMLNSTPEVIFDFSLVDKVSNNYEMAILFKTPTPITTLILDGNKYVMKDNKCDVTSSVICPGKNISFVYTCGDYDDEQKMSMTLNNISYTILRRGSCEAITVMSEQSKNESFYLTLDKSKQGICTRESGKKYVCENTEVNLDWNGEFVVTEEQLTYRGKVDNLVASSIIPSLTTFKINNLEGIVYLPQTKFELTVLLQGASSMVFDNLVIKSPVGKWQGKIKEPIDKCTSTWTLDVDSFEVLIGKKLENIPYPLELKLPSYNNTEPRYLTLDVDYNENIPYCNPGEGQRCLSLMDKYLDFTTTQLYYDQHFSVKLAPYVTNGRPIEKYRISLSSNSSKDPICLKEVVGNPTDSIFDLREMENRLQPNNSYTISILPVLPNALECELAELAFYYIPNVKLPCDYIYYNSKDEHVTLKLINNFTAENMRIISCDKGELVGSNLSLNRNEIDSTMCTIKFIGWDGELEFKPVVNHTPTYVRLSNIGKGDHAEISVELSYNGSTTNDDQLKTTTLTWNGQTPSACEFRKSAENQLIYACKPLVYEDGWFNNIVVEHGDYVYEGTVSDDCDLFPKITALEVDGESTSVIIRDYSTDIVLKLSRSNYNVPSQVQYCFGRGLLMCAMKTGNVRVTRDENQAYLDIPNLKSELMGMEKAILYVSDFPSSCDLQKYFTMEFINKSVSCEQERCIGITSLGLDELLILENSSKWLSPGLNNNGVQLGFRVKALTSILSVNLINTASPSFKCEVSQKQQKGDVFAGIFDLSKCKSIVDTSSKLNKLTIHFITDQEVDVAFDFTLYKYTQPPTRNGTAYGFEKEANTELNRKVLMTDNRDICFDLSGTFSNTAEVQIKLSKKYSWLNNALEEADTDTFEEMEMYIDHVCPLIEQLDNGIYNVSIIPYNSLDNLSYTEGIDDLRIYMYKGPTVNSWGAGIVSKCGEPILTNNIIYEQTSYIIGLTAFNSGAGLSGIKELTLSFGTEEEHYLFGFEEYSERPDTKYYIFSLDNDSIPDSRQVTLFAEVKTFDGVTTSTSTVYEIREKPFNVKLDIEPMNVDGKHVYYINADTSITAIVEKQVEQSGLKFFSIDYQLVDLNNEPLDITTDLNVSTKPLGLEGKAESNGIAGKLFVTFYRDEKKSSFFSETFDVVYNPKSCREEISTKREFAYINGECKPCEHGADPTRTKCLEKEFDWKMCIIIVSVIVGVGIIALLAAIIVIHRKHKQERDRIRDIALKRKAEAGMTVTQQKLGEMNYIQSADTDNRVDIFPSSPPLTDRELTQVDICNSSDSMGELEFF